MPYLKYGKILISETYTKTCLKIFDGIVSPILLYNTEVDFTQTVKIHSILMLQALLKSYILISKIQ